MKVLVVDDEANLRESLCKFLSLKGITAVQAGNGLSAQRLLETEVFSAAVVDLRMPGLDGLELLSWVTTEGLRVPVLIISAYGEVEDAVTALKKGAADYLVKPFDPAVMLKKLNELVSEQSFHNEIEAAARTAGTGPDFIGATKEANKIRTTIRLTADSPSIVLVTGESGTGKEIVARLLHASSARRSGPFVAVNIGGLPETLLESELFGYERGAFTGAVDRKIGMFELAAGGTLFLDEIGDMPLSLQVKILRTLQDLRVQRLGGSKAIPVDARIIAATNQDLEKRVAAGQFRADLFYRLNVVRIHIPPLRDRAEDIPLLAAHVLARLNSKLGRQIAGISASAIERLKAHAFPGNVRELENILERACLFATGGSIEIDGLELAAPLPRPSGVMAENPLTLRAVEKAAIERALQRWDGNRTRAAAELGIDRRTLFNKIKALGIA
jgi:two-component system, NtrC family, response regulator AtoC